MVLHRVLTDEQEQILKDERNQLMGLRGLLGRLDAPSDDARVLERAARQLDELFLLVVVGEFNAGKSAFVNALLGDRFLVEGVTPTTTEIQILKYGPEISRQQDGSELLVLTYPIDWLHEINIVDTPGTNAVIQRHQEITEDFVPRADLVLFITSADRPFTESERTFLQRVREWGKKVIFVVNKIDMLETVDDVEDVLRFVGENASQLLGRQPSIFPVSARQARQAKQTIDGDERTRLWAASRFEALEHYILDTLDERERLRLKLANPLGVARRLAERYLAVAQARRALLREDETTIQTLQMQLAGYEADMRRDFKYHLSLVDNALYGMAERGNRFFDQTIRLTRIFDLVNADRVRGMFEREVVADTTAQVEAATHDLIDWLVQQDFRQWQSVMEYLNRRIKQHHEQIVGQVGGQFEYNRQALLESVGRAARETVASYDKDGEARALAESVQMAVAQTALVEVGAIGLGTLLVHLLATTLADVTGILAATTMAAVGLYVIPNRRQSAKLNLQAKIADLRGRLAQAMSAQFERELSQSLERIREGVRPYTRFVEVQQASVAEIETGLSAAVRSLAALAARGKAVGRMDFNLRLLIDGDVPALQAVYEGAGALFMRYYGRPAGPDQAATDFVQALTEPERYQFGIFVDGELIGMLDCKLDPEVEKQAHIGLLLLIPPYDDPAIGSLAVRILTRWLVERFGVERLEASVPAHVPEEIAFWQQQGFDFTGQQYRRELAEFAPRFLVMAKTVDVMGNAVH